MELTVRVIRPSSREKENILSSRLTFLRSKNLIIRFDDQMPDPSWAYHSSTIQNRALALSQALLEPDSDFVMAARGGYGASDILPHLPWDQLKKSHPKILIGFSDISALHSGLYAVLGWPSIHGPMPLTGLWNKNSSLDTDELLGLMKTIREGSEVSGHLPLLAIDSVGSVDSSADSRSLRGPMFGGCFSVLTGLIGTPYFPATLKDHIIFIEDIDEHPGRLIRALNQWSQSGCLAGAKAFVVGYLKSMGEKIPDNAAFVLNRIASQLAPLPVFHTPLFGHTSPNFPIVLGAQAEIHRGKTTNHADLKWRWSGASSSPLLSHSKTLKSL